MPRAPSTAPQGYRHQRRQQRYRARLRKTGQTEADAVDAALAAAIVGVASDELVAEFKNEVLKEYLSRLLKRARRELLVGGHDREG